MDIPNKAFAEWRSVHAVPQVDHVTCLGGISPTYWQTMPCDWAGKTAGSDYLDLDCRSLTFVPPDCAAWLLDMKEDRPLSILSSFKSLFTLLTRLYPPFKEALDWLQLA